jgi:predicted CoA-binding protein
MYANKNIAVFGVSQDPSKYGYKIFATLLEKGFSVYAINPKGGEVLGEKIYSSLKEIPVSIDVAVLVIPQKALLNAVKQCESGGVKEVWFQPGTEDPTAYNMAKEAGMHPVNGCFMVDNGFW